MKYVYSLLDSSLVVGLPALIGVICGLGLYAEFSRFAPYVLGALAVAIIALLGGKWLMRCCPRTAWVFIEFWVLSALAVTALATAGLMWVTLDSSLGWLVDVSVITGENLKTLKTAFVTALSTYVALVWTKDIGDAKGMFWPSTQFKVAIADAYASLDRKPGGTTQAYQAIFQDVVDGHGNLGWSLPARGVRAHIFANFLKTPPTP